MSVDALQEAEAKLEKFSSAHRLFYLPILRAIALLGGRARKRDVTVKLRELLADQFNEKQLDYLESKNRFGWARLDLRKEGLVGGEYGWWELTPLGRAYLERHASDHVEIELDIPEAHEPAPRNQLTESVEVTAIAAYEIPTLEAMAAGHTDRSAIIDFVRARLEGQFRPGDARLVPRGISVFEFRTAWALSNLGKEGLAENYGHSQWRITPAGKQYLDRERGTWDIASFAPATAKVRSASPEQGEAQTTTVRPQTLERRWSDLRLLLGKSIHEAVSIRLAPHLGATPDRAISRNLIFYGPPGTGKTFLAKQIASALSGDADADDGGRFRLVQFHPSYAYEDFIQGLRPDIKQTTLRYVLTKGPFSAAAEAAEQDPDHFHVLVIDEINRGDPARIFGELLYALEYRGEAVALALGGQLVVPPNLVIIGTMNSVDRSVALVDHALRRRFGFVRIDPNPEAIASARPPGIIATIGPAVLEQFNQWLLKRLGKDHQLGHSYFLSEALPDDASAFTLLWDLDVRPLLEEYMFGDDATIEAAASTWRDIVKRELADRERVADDEGSSEP